MVDAPNSNKKKQQSTGNNKSFNDQIQTKIVLRHLPPTLTSEQFLEIVSPLPEHDYFRFCKPDTSLGQQHSFCRVYLSIPNQQDLIIFSEKFQGYVFLDKHGNEFPCLLEFAPHQAKPRFDQQTRKDPKMNSIDQDPDYQSFVSNMNAPLTGSEVLPNPELMLEEIEKKQREIHDSKNKSGLTSTPLLEFIKRKREEKKQKKQSILQNSSSRSIKQSSRNNEESRPSTARTNQEEDFYSSSRYGGSERSNRNYHRNYDKGDFRSSNKDQKRSMNSDQSSSKPSKQQNPKSKSNVVSNPKEAKQNQPSKSNNEEQTNVSPAAEPKSSRGEQIPSEEKPNSLNKSGSSNNSKAPKVRPSMQIYNPSERAKIRREQNQNS